MHSSKIHWNFILGFTLIIYEDAELLVWCYGTTFGNAMNMFTFTCIPRDIIYRSNRYYSQHTRAHFLSLVEVKDLQFASQVSHSHFLLSQIRHTGEWVTACLYRLHRMILRFLVSWEWAELFVKCLQRICNLSFHEFHGFTVQIALKHLLIWTAKYSGQR